MTESNATPAPLTMTPLEEATIERRIDEAIEQGADYIDASVAYKLWDELMETRSRLSAYSEDE